MVGSPALKTGTLLDLRRGDLPGPTRLTGRKGLQTVASRVHFRQQYRALVGHALVRARVLLLLLLLLRALSVLGDTV